MTVPETRETLTPTPASSPAVEPRRGSPLFRLIRPRQWVKNAFVLTPLVFAGKFTERASVEAAVIATALFCAAASFVYIVNDLIDIEDDRRHPVKRLTRPLASGEVSPGRARIVAAILGATVLLGFLWNVSATAVIVLYVFVNVLYSTHLKRIPVLDLFTLASGFVLRVQTGVRAIDVPLSTWMLITTLSLSLYLATMKRRQELATSGSVSRRVLEVYSLPLLDNYAMLSASAAIVFYGLFVVTIHPELAITMPLVLFGLFRYWWLVDRGAGESPTETVLTDRWLILTVALWGAACVWKLAPVR